MATPLPPHMSHLVTKIIPHDKKVLSLYKKMLRNLEAHMISRQWFRYEAVLLRKEFDDNKDVKDMVVAAKLLDEGQKRYKAIEHTHPKCFPYSEGGSAFDRMPPLPDHMVDYWDPIEKEAFPKYFALRELRKKEYIKLWENNFGRPA